MPVDEKHFTALGKEWVCRFDFNSICDLEERYDRPFLELVAPFLGSVDVADVGNETALVQAAAKIKFADLRAIFHQSLVAAQPDTTQAMAGEVIQAVGLSEVMSIVAWAITKAMPTGGDGAAKTNPSRRKG
jgi:hypothetical protein